MLNVQNLITCTFAVGSSLTESSQFLWRSLLLEKLQTYSLEEMGYCALRLSEKLGVNFTLAIGCSSGVEIFFN